MESEWAYQIGAMANRAPKKKKKQQSSRPSKGRGSKSDAKVKVKKVQHMKKSGQSGGRNTNTNTAAATTSSSPLNTRGGWPQAPTMGSVCAGMLTSAYAAMSLFMNLQHLWWCENNKDAAKFLKLNFPFLHGFTDANCASFLHDAAAVDILDAGFPCQPFSLDGKHLGAIDPRAGVIHSILLYVMKKLPRIVILENVTGLLTAHSETMEEILKALHSMKDPAYGNCPAYSVGWQILDAYTHGSVPQSRRRVYIVAIRTLGKKQSDVAVEFPGPVSKKSICRTLLILFAAAVEEEREIEEKRGMRKRMMRRRATMRMRMGAEKM